MCSPGNGLFQTSGHISTQGNETTEIPKNNYYWNTCNDLPRTFITHLIELIFSKFEDLGPYFLVFNDSNLYHRWSLVLPLFMSTSSLLLCTTTMMEACSHTVLPFRKNWSILRISWEYKHRNTRVQTKPLHHRTSWNFIIPLWILNSIKYRTPAASASP